MSRGRLIILLITESLWNSLSALLIGLPVALFLTELISLLSGKLIGLNLSGHHFTFSLRAVLWTTVGFAAVQLVSVLAVSLPLSRTEPAVLLKSERTQYQMLLPHQNARRRFIWGTALILTACALGIWGLKPELMLLQLLGFPLFMGTGIAGIFLFYNGLGQRLGARILNQAPAKTGLAVFTARQVQESALSRHKLMAVSALLLILALSCFSQGFGLIATVRHTEIRATDFTLEGDSVDIQRALALPEIAPSVKSAYPVYLSFSKDEISAEPIVSALRGLPDAPAFQNTIENLSGRSLEYVISVSSYNALLAANGEPPLELAADQAALYTSVPGDSVSHYRALSKACRQNIRLSVNGTTYRLLPELCRKNLTADRAITLLTALIVPDAQFAEMAREPAPYDWNLHLSDAAVDEAGLLNALLDTSGRLKAEGITCHSYLGSVGRQLFYAVSTGYLTTYLGILFLLISNTVLALIFLIQQRDNQARYRILNQLGASESACRRSVRRQVNLFFVLVLGVSAFSGSAVIAALFSNFIRLPVNTPMHRVALFSALALVALVLLECLYIHIVKKICCRELMRLPT